MRVVLGILVVGALVASGAPPRAAAGPAYRVVLPAVQRGGQDVRVPRVDALPVVPEIDQAMAIGLRAVHERGLAAGNRAGVFMKAGDSITYSTSFLVDVARGPKYLNLAGRDGLAPVVAYYARTTWPLSFDNDGRPDVGRGVENSFTRRSLASANGWTTDQALVRNPTGPVPGCWAPLDNSLMCEVAQIRPSVAVVMFGTAEMRWGRPDSLEAGLLAIVADLKEAGVVPILSTIPPTAPGHATEGKVADFNEVIARVAARTGTPLANYWRALQDLPDHGVSIDGLHPSAPPDGGSTADFSAEGLRYGYNVRNLVTLQALDAVTRAIEPGALGVR